jgi:threonine synthase
LAISVATAHPAKFPEEIETLLGITPPPCPCLEGLDSRKGEPVPMENDYEACKEYLLSRLKGS